MITFPLREAMCKGVMPFCGEEQAGQDTESFSPRPGIPCWPCPPPIPQLLQKQQETFQTPGLLWAQLHGLTGRRAAGEVPAG